MTGRDAYKIWSKAAGKWADWVRPVPFISPDTDVVRISVPSDDTVLGWLMKPSPDCAVIVDVPGNESVAEALGLARLGLRPVPLYNGCKAQAGVRAVADNSSIEHALILGAAELQNMEFLSDAPPVFMLDSNRMFRFKLNVSIFDNSWDIYPQDMPSGAFLSAQGIKKIIVRSQKLNRDLKAVLLKYQRAGIKNYITNGCDTAKEVTIRKPLRERD